MKNVKYITDGAGNKTALVIELRKLRKAKSSRQFLEEIEDTLDIILREHEPNEDWKKVKSQLLKKN